MAFEVIRASKPRYHQIEVSATLTLFIDLDDTWIAIKDSGELDDCTCIMIGIDDIDSLVLQLQQAREMLKNGL